MPPLNPRCIEDIAKVSIPRASPYELAEAKSFVNMFIQVEKQFNKKINPFPNVVRFAAATLMPETAYDIWMSTEQQRRLQAVYNAHTRVTTDAQEGSPCEIALATALVNDFIQLEKTFKGSIMPFRDVVHFAAGYCNKPKFDDTIPKSMQDLLRSVYYEYAP